MKVEFEDKGKKREIELDMGRRWTDGSRGEGTAWR